MPSYARDQSKNPPPMNGLDRVLRRFARLAYGTAVLFLYVLASTALGMALGFFIFGLALLVVLPLYNTAGAETW